MIGIDNGASLLKIVWLSLICYHLVAITESKFADNTALYVSSHDGFEVVASFFIRLARG